MDIERHPAGKVAYRKGVDRGTVETQARRVMLVHDGDQSKAVYPLGVLFANGVISESQHSAGCHLAWLYGVVFGRVSLAAMDYERGRVHAVEGDDSERREKWRSACQSELNRLLQHMESESHKAREAVVSVAVFEVLPRWAMCGIPTLSDLRLAQDFTKGMKALELALVGSNAQLTAS